MINMVFSCLLYFVPVCWLLTCVICSSQYLAVAPAEFAIPNLARTDLKNCNLVQLCYRWLGSQFVTSFSVSFVKVYIPTVLLSDNCWGNQIMSQ